MRDLLLFHWAPTTRRKQIVRYGLRPNMRPTQSGWRAPYVCFGTSPSWAWALSGALRPDIESWDLWQTWRSWLPENNRALREHDRRIKEVRAYERVYKRAIWYVGTREA